MKLPNLCVNDIREQFKDLLSNNQFTSTSTMLASASIVGSRTIEILGATFIADDNAIFGTVNEEWNKRELEWYKSQSLNVNDIPPPIPAVWKAVADKDGFINSNYGWCIWSEENGYQYDNVVSELVKNPASRRANMIYNRPSMWSDFNKNGRSDFMCTDSVTYFIRNNHIYSHVKMRSNDAVFGYKGDFHWQDYVLNKVIEDVNNIAGAEYKKGEIIWTASSLHVYERHFHLVSENYNENNVTKN